MTSYILRRLLSIVPVLLGVTLLVFAMLHLTPGDPVRMMMGEFQASPEQLELLRSRLHLDDPLPVQYGRFLLGAVQGDLGYSIRSFRPVTSEIRNNVSYTFELAVAALIVAAVVGVSLGVIAAIKQNSWADGLSMAVALVGVSMPNFWLGLLFIFGFSLHLGWFPASGAGEVRHIALPALTLGLSASAIIARITRSSMLEVLRNDYVTTARAKGLRESRVIIRHVLRNALIPVVTMFGLQFGNLLAGTVVVETVFARPGIGRLLVESIVAKDFPVVQGVVLIIAISYVLVNLVIDVLYAVLDPRIRYG